MQSAPAAVLDAPIAPFVQAAPKHLCTHALVNGSIAFRGFHGSVGSPRRKRLMSAFRPSKLKPVRRSAQDTRSNPSKRTDFLDVLYDLEHTTHRSCGQPYGFLRHFRDHLESDAMSNALDRFAAFIDRSRRGAAA